MSKFNIFKKLSINGKLFVAAQGTAANGHKYVMLRGIRGEYQEQITVFENQWDAFVGFIKDIDKEVRPENG